MDGEVESEERGVDGEVESEERGVEYEGERMAKYVPPLSSPGTGSLGADIPTAEITLTSKSQQVYPLSIGTHL